MLGDLADQRLRYFSGIQSRGSIRSLAAMVRSNEASSSGSASAERHGVLQDGVRTIYRPIGQ